MAELLCRVVSWHRKLWAAGRHLHERGYRTVATVLQTAPAHHPPVHGFQQRAKQLGLQVHTLGVAHGNGSDRALIDGVRRLLCRRLCPDRRSAAWRVINSAADVDIPRDVALIGTGDLLRPACRLPFLSSGAAVASAWPQTARMLYPVSKAVPQRRPLTPCRVLARAHLAVAPNDPLVDEANWMRKNFTPNNYC